MSSKILHLVLCIGFIIIGCCQTIQGQSVVGAEITYRHISANNYEVILDVYADCANPALNSTQTIDWVAPSCGVTAGTVNLNLQGTFPKEVSPICTDSITTCNGGLYFGVNHYQYRGPVTISNTCSDVVFSWEPFFRKISVINLIGANFQKLYVEAHLDASTPMGNSSPQFLYNPLFFTCTNQLVSYNNRARDIDGDSLVYQLVDCQQTGGASATYIVGHSGTNPFLTSGPSLSIDPNTGAITFNAAVINSQKAFCVLVEEYRNGVKIGSIVRDVNLRLAACGNVLPVMGGVNNSMYYQVNAMVNKPLSFYTIANDWHNNNAINLDLTYEPAILGATFAQAPDPSVSPEAIRGVFNWTPTLTDIGKHQFTLYLDDGNCPRLGKRVNTYVVNVLPAGSAGTVNAGPDHNICSGDTVQLNAVGGISFQWTPAAGLSSTLVANPKAFPDTTTTYHVLATYADGSTSTDQVVIHVATRPIGDIDTVATENHICQGSDIHFFPVTLSGPLRYHWEGPNNFVSNLASPSIYGATSIHQGIYTLRVEDTISGCLSPIDTIDVEIHNPPNPLPFIATSTPICEGDVIRVDEQVGVICDSVSWIGPKGPQNGNIYFTEAHPLDSNYTTGIWRLQCIDTVAGCVIESNPVFVSIEPLPPTPVPTTNGPICIGDTAILSVPVVLTNNANWYSNPGGTFQVYSGYNAPIAGITTDTVFYVQYLSANFCPSPLVSVNVEVHPPATTPDISSDLIICEGDEIHLFTNTIANVYQWNHPSRTLPDQSNIFILPSVLADSGQYTLAIIDTNGCQSMDTSVHVQINPLPTAPLAQSNSAICEGEPLKLFHSGGCNTTQWIAPNGNVIVVTTDTLTILSTNINYVAGDWEFLCLNAAGCVDTSNKVSVQINRVPPVVAAFNNGPICMGDTVRLGAALLSGANYSWYADSLLTSPIISGTGARINVPNITTDSIFYVETRWGICTSVSNTLVQVHPPSSKPEVPNDFDLCQGDTLRLETPTIANQYVWTTPLGNTFNGATVAFIGTTTGAYNLSIIDTNGCAVPDTSVFVTVHTPPTAPIITGAAVCQGDSLVLVATGSCDSIEWIPPLGPAFIGSDTLVVLSSNNNYVNGGLWRARCINQTTNCSSLPSVGYVAVIHAIPPPPVVVNSGPVCHGDSVQLSTPIVLGATYKWYTHNWTNFLGGGPMIVVPNITTDTIFRLSIKVNGCVNSDTTEVKVHLLPPTPALPDSIVTCELDSILFNAAPYTSYQWTGPNGFFSTQQAPFIYPATLADTGQYTLIVGDANNCFSEDSSVQVIVHPLPLPPVIAAHSTAICDGDSIVLIANTNCGKMEWIGPSGTSLVAGDTLIIDSTHLDYQNGNWTLTCTDTVTGCQSVSNTISITIKALPVVPVFANTSPICAGDSIELSMALVAGASYQWFTIDSILIGSLSSITIPSLTQDSLFYGVIEVNGCSNFDTAFVKVNALPAQPFAAVAKDTLCASEFIELQVNNPMGGLVYNWTGPNAYADTGRTAFVSPIDVSYTGTYTLNAVDTNGCQSLDSSVFVVVHPLPAQPVIVGTSTLCHGDTIRLEAPVCDSLVWNNIAFSTIIPITGSPYLTLGLGMAGYDTVEHWQVRCFDQSTGCVSQFSTPFRVELVPLPTGINPTNSGPICVHESAQLIANQQASPATYIWSTDTLLTDTIGIGTSIWVDSIDKDSTFYVEVTSALGCRALDSTRVLVHGTLAPPMAMAVNAMLCEGENVALGETAYPMVGYDYQWTGPNGFVSQAKFPTIATATANQSGFYHVVVIDSNGCQSISDSIQVTIHAQPSKPILTGGGNICYGDSIIVSSNTSCDSSVWQSAVDTIIGSQLQLGIFDLGYTNTTWTLSCHDTLSGCFSVSDPIVINIIPTPSVPTIANNSPICDGDSAIFITPTVLGATNVWYSDAAMTTIIGTGDSVITKDTVVFLQQTVNGCSAIASDTALYLPIPPAPIVGANLSICEGDPIHLTTTTAANAYQWTHIGGFNSTLQNPIIPTATLADAGDYTLSLIDTNGCPTPSAVLKVTVYLPPPTPIIFADDTVCQGDTVILGTSPGNAAIDLRWFTPLNTILRDSILYIKDTSIHYISGNWTLVYIDTITGCQSQTDTTIIIETIPTSGAIVNSGPVCIGDSVQLSAAPISNVANYIWYKADTTILGYGQNISIPNIVSDTFFGLVVETNAGCRYFMDTNFVFTHPPAAMPSIVVNTNYCVGDQISFTTSPAAAYEWTGPQGLFSYQQSPSINAASLADSGRYELRVEDIYGCLSPVASVVVAVHALPTAPIAQVPAAVCDGDTLYLNSTAGTCDSAYWVGPSNSILQGANLSIASDSIHYQNGNWQAFCFNQSTGCQSGSNIVTTNILPSPNVTVVNNSPVCRNESVQLTASSMVGASYFWFSDSLKTDTIGTTANIWVDSIVTDSIFYVEVVDSNGCFSSLVSTTVVVHPLSSAPSIGADIRVCVGERIHLTTAVVATGYQWNGPNGYASIQANPTIFNADFVDAGNYTLAIVDSNGCYSADTSLQVRVDSLPLRPSIDSFVYLCQGDTLWLSSNSTASHCDWVEWHGPSGQVLSATGTTTAILPTDTINYVGGLWRLRCIDSTTGCWSQSNVSLVFISSSPDTQATFHSGPVCVGGNVDLWTASAGALASYTWYADSTLTTIAGTGQQATIRGITTDTIFYLVISNRGGCTSTPMATSVPILPLGNPPVVPADTQYCEGDIIEFTTPTAALHYFWSASNGFSDTLQHPIVSTHATVLDSGWYSLQVVDSNLCLSTTAAFYVEVHPAPLRPILTSNSPLCNGDTLHLESSGQCGQTQWIGPYGNNPSTLGQPGGSNHLWTIGSTTFIPPSDSNYGNHNWYMICIDTLTGCRALSDTIAVQIDTAPTVINISNTGPICYGDTVHLAITTQTNSGAAVLITWYSEATMSQVVGVGANPVLTNIFSTSTVYAEILDSLTGCVTYDSTIVVVYPQPPSPILPPNIMVCEGDTVRLTTSTVASAYLWSGPNGFVATQQHPTPFVASMIDTGIYDLVVVDNNNCISSRGTVHLMVNPAPPVPVAVNNGPACVGDSIVLTASTIAGAVYEWFKLPTQTSVGMGQNYALTNLSLADTGYYYVVVNLNGCTTTSNSTEVQIYNNSIATAIAGPDQSLCALDSTTITANVPSGSIIGTWTSNSSAIIVNPNSATTLVANLSVGTHVFYWTLSSSTCPSISTDSLLVTITTPSSDIANAGLNQALCADSTAVLSGNQPILSTGTWVQSTAQANLGVAINAINSPASSVTGLLAGNTYQFIWSLDHGACGVHSTDTVWIRVDALPNNTAIAGGDITTCSQDTIVLAANAPNLGTGLWTTNSGAILITPTQHTTVVTNLLQDTSRFVWTLSNGACLDYAADTILVIRGGESPIANADYFSGIANNQAVTINVIPNDILTSNWNIYINTPMNSGRMQNLNNGQFELDLQGATTTQQFIYELCNPACPANCDTALVVLEVQQAGDCHIPNIFTPNGDGTNDLFEVPCLEGQQGTWLKVFNRWGDLVYETDNYQNQWDGTHLGQDLPDGTYFYIIKIGNQRELQGSIELRR